MELEFSGWQGGWIIDCPWIDSRPDAIIDYIINGVKMILGWRVKIARLAAVSV